MFSKNILKNIHVLNRIETNQLIDEKEAKELINELDNLKEIVTNYLNKNNCKCEIFRKHKPFAKRCWANEYFKICECNCELCMVKGKFQK